jgi:hypothetical protein
LTLLFTTWACMWFAWLKYTDSLCLCDEARVSSFWVTQWASWGSPLSPLLYMLFRVCLSVLVECVLWVCVCLLDRKSMVWNDIVWLVWMCGEGKRATTVFDISCVTIVTVGWIFFLKKTTQVHSNLNLVRSRGGSSSSNVT